MPNDEGSNYICDLGNLPSQPMREELERRRLAEHDARVKRRKEHQALIIEHVATLLLFAKHGYSDCNDASPINELRHCARCVLLTAQKYPELLEEDLELTLDLINVPIVVRQSEI